VGKEQRGAGLGQQGEGAVLFRKAHRAGQPRHVRSGDLAPAQHQRGIAETGMDESGEGGLARIHADRAGPTPA